MMKPYFLALLFFVLTGFSVTNAQKADRVKFFEDTAVINATLSLNIKNVLAKKNKPGLVFPANFSCTLPDGKKVSDAIEVKVRGHFRRGYCYLPPLKLYYKTDKNNTLYHLKTLKLVSSCMPTESDDQNLLKEFLIYKMYNLLTDKSFRVRLLNMTYADSSGKKKPVTQHAFLVEDIGELFKRVDCDEWKGKKATEMADRRQMTLVNFFEFMIGNTDWSVTGDHNIQLMHANKDSLSRPYPVPYDFDFSGFVNTTYSAPDERLGITSVRQRLYRGYPRTAEELADVVEVFNKQKPNIYATVNNFNLLMPKTRKYITDYLDGFYKAINNPAELKRINNTNGE